MSSEKILRDNIINFSKRIPEFIDTKDKIHNMMYNDMYKIFELISRCVDSSILSDDDINVLSIDIYSLLLRMFNCDKDVYRMCVDYIMNLYEEVMKISKDEELYETANNLYKVINVKINDLK